MALEIESSQEGEAAAESVALIAVWVESDRPGTSTPMVIRPELSPKPPNRPIFVTVGPALRGPATGVLAPAEAESMPGSTCLSAAFMTLSLTAFGNAAATHNKNPFLPFAPGCATARLMRIPVVGSPAGIGVALRVAVVMVDTFFRLGGATDNNGKDENPSSNQEVGPIA